MRRFRRQPTGRLLRLAEPAGAPCECRWPLALPWRRFRVGAVWECATCSQQWAWRSMPEGARWIALPRDEWIGAALTTAWRTVLYGSTAE